MTERLPSPQLLLRINALRDRALAADSLNALAFSMANDAYSLLQYHQALVLALHGEQVELLCVSGLAKPAEDSPYLVWLKRHRRRLGRMVARRALVYSTARPRRQPAGLGSVFARCTTHRALARVAR